MGEYVAYHPINDIRRAIESFSDELRSISERIATPTVIHDTYIRLDSFTRSGINHVVSVKDGVVSCSCEAAYYHPERICKHVRALVEGGEVDARAIWAGHAQ